MDIEIAKVFALKFNLSQEELKEMSNDIDSLMRDAVKSDKGKGCAIFAPQRIGKRHFKVVIEVDTANDHFRLDVTQLTIDEYLDFMNELKDDKNLIEIKQ